MGDYMQDFFFNINNKYISLKELESIKNNNYYLYKKYKNIKYIFNIKALIFKKYYKNLDKYIKKHNNKIINKLIKDTDILLSNVNGYSLDYNQRLSILSDEAAALIVAGAGSGKTLTMIGKIKYLISYQHINPKEILCISFTNFTTLSLKKAISREYNYDIDVLTFHKLGLKILKEGNEYFKICNTSLLSNIIKDYFKYELIMDKKLFKDFITYLIINSNIKLDNNNIDNLYDTIVSNYLYLFHIKYEYRCMGVYKDTAIYAFYLNDYNIYIECHNYINNNNNLSVFDLFDYLDNVRCFFKCKVYEFHPIDFTDGSVYLLLKDIFKEFNIKINDEYYEKIYDLLMSKGNVFANLLKIIESFINIFKANNYSFKKLDEVDNKIKNIKNKLIKKQEIILFIIIKKIYVNYQIYLEKNKLIDFHDMINKATNLVLDNKVNLKYKYIIIDEYQDTSYSRYNLIGAIKDKTKSSLLAVGDDFQSIYRFNGCNIDMFVNFKKYFLYSKYFYITNTYRNSKELIKVSGDFIMKNKYQIKKELNSNKSLDKPIKIYRYKDNSEIDNLFSLIKEDNILILGRNNRDIDNFNDVFDIFDDKVIYKKDKDKNIRFMSVHKSKGLEEDVTVIINLEDKLLGFPNKLEDDILIKMLLPKENNYLYDEERRLFYVALTRTKGNVYLFVSKKKASIFVDEIIKDNYDLIEFLN